MKKGVIPIPKASSPRHMLEDIESADFKLSSPEIKYIDNLTSVSGNKYKSSAAFRKVVDVYLLLDSKLNRKSGSRKK
jgi:diketogulonate reductase-like aldo/keto reductase